MGSVALRIAGLENELKQLGHKVEDKGDLAFTENFDVSIEGNAKFAPYIAGWTRALEVESHDLLSAGAFPVFLGGDHSLSMGSVSGAARYARQQGKKLHVLWIDAHTDFNTPLTSPSGNMHGMPVAFFCGEEGFGNILREDRATVDPSNVHMMGIRCVDRKEKALITQRGVNIHDMRSIDEHRIVPIMTQILDKVAKDNAMLHVSFDADGVDPSIAPGVGTPVKGGFTYREAHLMMEMIYDSGLATSLDIVEVNPYIDEAGKTARLMVDLAGSFFGKKTLY